MQQFIKMRKQVSMTEATRLVLNKSIDLLHKLSNGKLAREEVKKEISVLLSTYFVTVYPETEKGVDADAKLKLEHVLDQAYDIVYQVESGKAPLYEAIMLMNKVVVSIKPLYEENDSDDRGSVFAKQTIAEKEVVRFRPAPEYEMREPFPDPEVEQTVSVAQRLENPMEPKEVSRAQPINKTSRETDVSDLMNAVIQQKKALENSIAKLNASLEEIGFELRSLK